MKKTTKKKTKTKQNKKGNVSFFGYALIVLVASVNAVSCK